jgi:hypothetical protein
MRLCEIGVGGGYTVEDRIHTALKNVQEAADILTAADELVDAPEASASELLGAISIIALKDDRLERVGGLTTAEQALSNGLYELREVIDAIKAYQQGGLA